MKLSQFISILQKIQIEAGDNDPTVVLADWAENYALPNEWAAEAITFCDCEYRSKEKEAKR